MNIRDATLVDVPALIELGHLMHKESPRFTRLRYNGEKVGKQIAALIMAPYGFVRVVEKDAKIIAALAGFVLPDWCSDDLVAHQLVLYAEESARGHMLGAGLIDHFKDWSFANGAVFGTCGISTGVLVEQTAKLFETQGLQYVGPIYEFTKD